MKTILLLQNYTVIVDDEDFDFVSRFRWWVEKRHGTNYAITRINGKKVYLHKLLIPGQRIDHVNGDGLDNRRENLRPCSFSQNGANQRKRLGTTSQYKGVHWDSRARCWMAGLRKNGKNIFRKKCDTEEAAARAYDEAALKHFGDYAAINFPEGRQQTNVNGRRVVISEFI